MSESTIWWLLAGAAVVVELVTGTFYLLMLAVGLAAGAIAAYFGFSLVAQLLVASVVGGGAVLLWHLARSRAPKPLPASANHDVNLDIGGAVQVEAWNPDGTASVRLRGAVWTAVPAGPTDTGIGSFRIREMVGNRLVIERI